MMFPTNWIGFICLFINPMLKKLLLANQSSAHLEISLGGPWVAYSPRNEALVNGYIIVP